MKQDSRLLANYCLMRDAGFQSHIYSEIGTVLVLTLYFCFNDLLQLHLFARASTKPKSKFNVSAKTVAKAQYVLKRDALQ